MLFRGCQSASRPKCYSVLLISEGQWARNPPESTMTLWGKGHFAAGGTWGNRTEGHKDEKESQLEWSKRE
jgi:hypothetical protein